MFHTIALAAVLAGFGGIVSAGQTRGNAQPKPAPNGACCIMRSSADSTCCNMCPECCEQKSCAKSCCNISACTNRPICCA